MPELWQFSDDYRDKVESAKKRIRAADKSIEAYLLAPHHDHKQFYLLLEEARMANREYVEIIVDLAKTQTFGE
jgi:hypothetical protein